MSAATLYGLKHRFVSFHMGTVGYLLRRGVPPVAVTLVAIPVVACVFASLVTGLAAPWSWLLAGPLLLTLMSLNAVDGTLARAAGTETRSGAALNEIVDRLGDLAIMGAAFFLVDARIAGVAMGLVLLAEIVALIGWGAYGQRALSGPMGKPDRAFVIGGASAVAFFAGQHVFTIGFLVVALGALATTVTRIGQVLRVAAAIDVEARNAS